MNAVRFESIGNEFVKVFWEPPKYTTCIHYYYLIWCTLDCVHGSKCGTQDESKAISQLNEVVAVEVLEHENIESSSEEPGKEYNDGK